MIIAGVIGDFSVAKVRFGTVDPAFLLVGGANLAHDGGEVLLVGYLNREVEPSLLAVDLDLNLITPLEDVTGR